MFHWFAVQASEPTARPDPEIPHPNPSEPPKGTPNDPVNVPPPSPDVVFPVSEPSNIPVGPGPDIPEMPIPSEVMMGLMSYEAYVLELSRREAYAAACLLASARFESRSRARTLH
jgi:hypothetical protein